MFPTPWAKSSESGLCLKPDMPSDNDRRKQRFNRPQHGDGEAGGDQRTDQLKRQRQGMTVRTWHHPRENELGRQLRNSAELLGDGHHFKGRPKIMKCRHANSGCRPSATKGAGTFFVTRGHPMSRASVKKPNAHVRNAQGGKRLSERNHALNEVVRVRLRTEAQEVFELPEPR